MNCSKCGKQISTDQKFCPFCGTEQHISSKEPMPSNTPSKLLYTAKHSVWIYRWRMTIAIILMALSLILAVACFTDKELTTIAYLFIGIFVISLFAILLYILCAKAYEIKIFSDKIIVKEGLINRRESQCVMTPILGVSIHQSLNGQIWNYGNIRIDKVGKGWDINSNAIKNPKKFKSFLESLINSTYSDANRNSVQMHIMD